jgi:NADPH-dependent glutamate synthase beta subunit-like oxidoreductase
MLKRITQQVFQSRNRAGHTDVRLICSKSAPRRIGIVGAGPAGFYVAHRILSRISDPTSVSIDIFEKLPAPFGLVRYGVAPDHPEVKVGRYSLAL